MRIDFIRCRFLGLWSMEVDMVDGLELMMEICVGIFIVVLVVVVGVMVFDCLFRSFKVWIV